MMLIKIISGCILYVGLHTGHISMLPLKEIKYGLYNYVVFNYIQFNCNEYPILL